MLTNEHDELLKIIAEEGGAFTTVGFHSNFNAGEKINRFIGSSLWSEYFTDNRLFQDLITEGLISGKFWFVKLTTAGIIYCSQKGFDMKLPEGVNYGDELSS